MSKEINGMQPAAIENKFRHTARRTIKIKKIPGPRDNLEIQGI
jgi:hypothetical protein